MICGSSGEIEDGRATAGNEEEDECIFAGFTKKGECRAGRREGVLVGNGMAAFKIAESPVTCCGRLVGTTDAAQAFAALHSRQQDLEHWSGSLADSDDKDAFKCGEIDGGGTATVGHEAVKSVAIEAQAAIKCGSDVARLERAGENTKWPLSA